MAADETCFDAGLSLEFVHLAPRIQSALEFDLRKNLSRLDLNPTFVFSFPFVVSRFDDHFLWILEIYMGYF